MCHLHLTCVNGSQTDNKKRSVDFFFLQCHCFKCACVFGVINAVKHKHMPRPGRTAGGGLGGQGGEKRTEIRNVDGRSLQFVGSERKANKGQLL